MLKFVSHRHSKSAGMTLALRYLPHTSGSHWQRLDERRDFSQFVTAGIRRPNAGTSPRFFAACVEPSGPLMRAASVLSVEPGQPTLVPHASNAEPLQGQDDKQG